MAHRIYNEDDNGVYLNLFGLGKHGYDDVKPGRTRMRAADRNMMQEEIVRVVEPFMPLAGKESSYLVPKHNQMQQIIYGLPAAHAAFTLEAITDMGLTFNGIVTCGSSFQAGTGAGYKSLGMLGQDYRELVLRRDDSYLTVGPQIVGEDPRAMVEIEDECWVAVGTGGSIFKRDGGGPSQPVSGTTEELTCIAYNEDDDILIAAGDAGVCIKSTDKGDTWSPVTVTGASNDDYGAIVFADGEFVLFQNSTQLCYFSVDGVTWTERSHGLTSVNDVAYLPLTKMFMAVGANGNCMRSSDKFVSRTTIQLQGMQASVFSVAANPEGNIFVAVGRDDNGDDLMAVNIGGLTDWRYKYFDSAGGTWFVDTHVKIRFINGRFFFPNENAKLLRSSLGFGGNAFQKY
jgi:WD40 repeat protein